jgi:hypothetical protein
MRGQSAICRRAARTYFPSSGQKIDASPSLILAERVEDVRLVGDRDSVGAGLLAQHLGATGVLVGGDDETALG